MGEWQSINTTSIYETIWVCTVCGKEFTLHESYDLLDALHMCDICHALLWLKDMNLYEE